MHKALLPLSRRSAGLAAAGAGTVAVLGLAGSYLVPQAVPTRVPAAALLALVLALAGFLARSRQTMARALNRSELSRERDQALVAGILAETREGIVITGPDAAIIDVNRAFSDITGYAREEVIGKNPRLLKSGRQDARFYAGLWQTLLATGYWQGEIWNRRKNGELLGEAMTIRAVRDSRGRTTHYIGVFTDITARKLEQDALAQPACRDPLTRLPNRILLADRLQQALRRAEHGQARVAVCHLGLDDFKAIGERLGRAAGDRILSQVAQRLEAAVPARDTVAHLGGEEFVLLLADLESVDEIDAVLARVGEAVNVPCAIDARPVSVAASIGVSLFPADAGDPDTLLRQARQAMGEARLAGGNRVHMFGCGEDELACAWRSLRARIKQGLAKEEFALYWQPQVDMESGRVIGAEALIRWPQADGSLLMPEDFLPHFEHDDLIVDLGNWILRTALRQVSDWNEAGLNLNVSVNVAARHLQMPGFGDHLAALLSAHPRVRPGQFEIEVVETAALDDLEHISRLIERCRGMGVSFALDDFGTGYSSMTYFRRLPVDTVKIDQSFVRDMLSDLEALTIVAGILGMTSAFGKETVAEGVESVEHGVALLRLGCPLAQGYAVSPALPAPEFARWLAAYRPPPAWADALDADRRRDDFPLAGLKRLQLLQAPAPGTA